MVGLCQIWANQRLNGRTSGLAGIARSKVKKEDELVGDEVGAVVLLGSEHERKKNERHNQRRSRYRAS